MDVVNSLYHELEESLKNLAIAHRYTIMNARTHGQEAELQSFGARVLTWLKDLRVVYNALYRTRENLRYSKLSGAIGKYGSIDPKVEKETLRILGFEPFYGSTQIMPRALYAPIADALCYLALVVDKIANDIRLAARSGNPLMQEPFGKKQTGSSAMPHKKNPIRLEGIEGNAAMAQGYALMITNCIKTWEERAIHQSRVERVGWPDLFHVVVNSLETLNGVIKGLKVYPDNMLEEVYKSRGVYASSEVKESLKKHLCTENFGLDHEDVYRIVQLACFNVFEPLPERENIRNTIASSLEQSVELLKKLGRFVTNNSMVCSIEEFIPLGALRVSKQLDINEERIREYNDALRKLFHCDDGSFRGDVMDDWHELFTPGFLLKNETVLYKEILGLES